MSRKGTRTKRVKATQGAYWGHRSDRVELWGWRVHALPPRGSFPGLNTRVFSAAGNTRWSSSSCSTWSPSLVCRVTYCSWTPRFSSNGCCPACWGTAPCGSCGRWWRLSWTWKQRTCCHPKPPKVTDTRLSSSPVNFTCSYIATVSLFFFFKIPFSVFIKDIVII